MDLPELTDLLRRTGEGVAATLDAAFASVEVVRERAAQVLGPGTGPATRTSLSALHPLFQQLLSAQPNPLEGVGLAVGTGVLRDADRWMEWWRREPSGRVGPTPYVLDPSALGFYDYPSRPWFRTPLEVQQQVAVGPYLDVGGCDVYTTTLAAPLALAPGRQVVVGGDLDMARLEASFLREVGRRSPAVAVVASNDRVVVSNTAQLTSGSRMGQRAKDAVVAEEPVASLLPGRCSWRLVALGQR